MRSAIMDTLQVEEDKSLGNFPLVDRERDPKLYNYLINLWYDTSSDFENHCGNDRLRREIQRFDYIIQRLTGLENPYYEEEERNDKKN